MSIALFLQTIFGDIPLYNICSSSENFTSNDQYESNLRKLLGNLNYHTPSLGFGLGWVGWYQYQTHGIALCGGDVAAADCKACVNDASNEIHKLCPYDKGAIIWYDNCLLKYSNKDFLGQIDNENWFSILNVQNVSESNILNQKARELLSQLAKDASFTTKKYAAGELERGNQPNCMAWLNAHGTFLPLDVCSVLMMQLVNFLVVVMGKEGELLVGVAT